MKLTLLELVQDMLTAMDSENVSDVGETEEAGQCVNLANQAFEQMATSKRWRHFKQYTRLSTTSALNEMVPPSGTYAVDYANLWYEGQRVWYVEPDKMMEMTINRESTNTTNSNDILIYTDRNPTYWTSDDDYTFIFDAIPDSTNGLTSTNTRAIAWIAPTSRLSTNSAYFDLPAQAFPALSALCQSMAVGILKGDSGEAQRLRRDYTRMMGSLARNARLIEKPNDMKKNIVARRTMKNMVDPIINE
jgi:hypothetical protein